jgi:hypothetical protein
LRTDTKDKTDTKDRTGSDRTDQDKSNDKRGR